MINYGKIIRERRKALGWSYTYLAYIVGYSKRTIFNVEHNNSHKCSFEVIDDILDALGLELKVVGKVASNMAVDLSYSVERCIREDEENG